MTTKLVTICDVCNKPRDANKWLSYLEDEKTGAVALIPFGLGGLHLCGEACWQKVSAAAAARLRAGTESTAPERSEMLERSEKLARPEMLEREG